MPAKQPTIEPSTEAAEKLLWPNSIGTKPPTVEPRLIDIQSTLRSMVRSSAPANGSSIPHPGRERLPLMDRWEEGFDTWIPPLSEAVDPRAEDEREELLRLARELGAARSAAHEAELEPLKRALREAAEAAAAHAHELAELRRRLEGELAEAQAIRVALEQERGRLDARPSFAEGIAELTPKARDADPSSAAGR